jgi:uncharacterized alpha-E superfamily protein
MYRKRYHGLTVHRVVEFLVLDRHFPRAIHHCLFHANESMHAITGTPRDTFRNGAEQYLGRLCAELMFLSIDEIIDQGMHEFIDGLQTSMNRIGDAICETFFSMKAV